MPEPIPHGPPLRLLVRLLLALAGGPHDGFCSLAGERVKAEAGLLWRVAFPAVQQPIIPGVVSWLLVRAHQLRNNILHFVHLTQNFLHPHNPKVS